MNALAREIVDDLHHVPGCREAVVLRTAPHRLTSLVVYEARVHAEAATPTIAAFLERVATHLTRLPERRIYAALYHARFCAERPPRPRSHH